MWRLQCLSTGKCKNTDNVWDFFASVCYKNQHKVFQSVCLITMWAENPSSSCDNSVSVTLVLRCLFLPSSSYYDVSYGCIRTVWDHLLHNRLFLPSLLLSPGIFYPLHWINAAPSAHKTGWGTSICWWEAAWPLDSRMTGCSTGKKQSAV